MTEDEIEKCKDAIHQDFKDQLAASVKECEKWADDEHDHVFDEKFAEFKARNARIVAVFKSRMSEFGDHPVEKN